MSGNDTRMFRKIKQECARLYKKPPRKRLPKKSKEVNQEYFGELEARDRYGVLQLTALGAAFNQPIISSSRPCLSRAINTTRKRSKKAP